MSSLRTQCIVLVLFLSVLLLLTTAQTFSQPHQNDNNNNNNAPTASRTASYRLLFASPYHAQQTHNVVVNMTTISPMHTESNFRNITYGEFSPYYSVLGGDLLRVEFIGCYNVDPVVILLKPSLQYTIVLFDVDYNAHISQYWDQVSSTTSWYGIVGVLNNKDYLTDTDNRYDNNEDVKKDMSADFNMYRIVNLVQPSRLPKVYNPQTAQMQTGYFSLLYRSHECIDCNYCVMVTDLSRAQLSYQDADLKYLSPPADDDATLQFTSQILLFKKRDHYDFSFNVGVITPITLATFQDQVDDAEDYILHHCHYPENKQVYYIATNTTNYLHPLSPREIPHSVVVNDPHHEFQQHTIFIIPPAPSAINQHNMIQTNNDNTQEPQQEQQKQQQLGAFHVSEFLMVQDVDDKGPFVYTPLFFALGGFLGVYIIIVAIIKLVQSQQLADHKRKQQAEHVHQQELAINNNPRIYLPDHGQMSTIYEADVVVQQYIPSSGSGNGLQQRGANNNTSRHSPPGVGAGPQQQQQSSSSSQSLLPPQSPQPQQQQKQPPPPRLQSLDVFRGLIILGMVFSNTGGGGYVIMDHSLWDGWYWADLIFPGFVFIMGLSNSLSQRTNQQNVTKFALFQDILKRSLKLFAIGLFLANVGKYKTFRPFGILQRFAIAYFSISVLNLLPKMYNVADMEKKATTSAKDNTHHQRGTEPLLLNTNSLLNLSTNSFLNGDTVGINGDFDSDPNGDDHPHHHYTNKDNNNNNNNNSPITSQQTLLKSAFQLIWHYELKQNILQWVVMACVVVVWCCVFLFVAAPGCPVGYAGPGGPYVANGKYALLEYHGELFQCTGGITNIIDRVLLGFDHIYSHPTPQVIYNTSSHDPEGVWGSLMTIFCAFLGMVVGRVLNNAKSLNAVLSKLNHTDEGTATKRLHALRMLTWVLLAAVHAAITLLITQHGYPIVDSLFYHKYDNNNHNNWHSPTIFSINKNLWTLSFVEFNFVFLTLFFTFTYFFVDYLFAGPSQVELEDVQGKKVKTELWGWATPIRFVGLNSLMFFILPNVLATKFPFTWTIYTPARHLELTLQSLTALSSIFLIATYCFYNNIIWKV